MNAEYTLASRANHPENTIIDVQGNCFGNGSIQIIAGPCSVDSREQVIDLAREAKAAGATMLRGGAFKPRTSPYSFQGLGKEGIEYLLEAKSLTGLPVVSELVDKEDLPLFHDIDIIQVGAKNMQNYALLKALGKIDKPVILKRGWSNTLEELLLSAEYILAGGNNKVILCERGIRTFEPLTRNTFDVSAIPLLKELSHLPVIADPSHGTGVASLVGPAALAGAIVGADGLLIEIHNYPECALCDGKQAITSKELSELVNKIAAVTPFAYQR
ncbi:MAG: 3-deoxy-7-phosphoheptulonate synthase [Anaerovoracaceae bacterium]